MVRGRERNGIGEWTKGDLAYDAANELNLP